MTDEPSGTPLTLSEARMVANQIRGTTVDREYWAWVIEELCKMVENQARPLLEVEHTKAGNQIDVTFIS